MKLPRFLANSVLAGAQEIETDFDSYEFADDVDGFTVKLWIRDESSVAIQDVANGRTHWFKKSLDDLDDAMHEDLIEYTLYGYGRGRYFEFDDDEHQYTEITPLKYYDEFGYKHIESGKYEFLYLTNGFEDLNFCIPDCAEDRATNLETIEDVTEFMCSLGYERLGA